MLEIMRQKVNCREQGDCTSFRVEENCLAVGLPWPCPPFPASCAFRSAVAQSALSPGGRGGRPSGHEIVGRIVKIGNAVTKFKEGDLAAVGCMMDSDRTCEACCEGEEQFCARRPVFTYNGPRQASRRRDLRRVFTKHRRSRRLRSPCAEKLSLAATAPLLC